MMQANGDGLKQRRIEVLCEWRNAVDGLGFPVPSVEDMVLIGGAGNVHGHGTDLDTVLRWQETIEFLIEQVHDLHPDPVAAIPPHLRKPATVDAFAGGRHHAPPSSEPPSAGPLPSAGPSSGGQSADEPVLAALLAWKRERQPGNPQLQGLKDSHLRSIVANNCRTEEEISRQLPGDDLKVFAAHLVEVVARATGSAARPSASKPDPTQPRPGGWPDGTAQPAAESSRTPPTGAPGAGGPGTVEPEEPDAELVEQPDPELVGLRLADLNSRFQPGGSAPMGRQPTKKGVRLSWPEHQAGHGTVIYRVVSADDWRPLNPQRAYEVTRTRSTTCLDVAPFRGPVRYVQVWRHVGASLWEAASAEPVLHAETEVIAPVQNPEVATHSGAVHGVWSVPDGVERVLIQRIPVSEEARSGGSGHRILGDRDNKNGFEDRAAEPGVRYVYLISVEANVNGQPQISDEAIRFEVTVPPKLVVVTDLRVTRTTAGTFDLSWTPAPAGEVRIYRTSETLTAQAVQGGVVKPLVQLSERGADGRMHIRGATLGDDQASLAYFTPVTSLHGNIELGTPQSAIAVPPVTDAEIVERSFNQFLTFSWPSGADEVHAYLAAPPRGGETQEALDRARENAVSGQPDETISKEMYESVGGLQFRRPLGWRGCLVHVVPAQYSNYVLHPGTPATVPYRGLARMHYQLRADTGKQANPAHRFLRIFSEEDHSWSPAFALVHNPDRFPLHSDDGQKLTVQPLSPAVGQGGLEFWPSALLKEPGNAAWGVSVAGLTGYVRLFACLTAEKAGYIALFDPPMAELRLGVVG